MHKNGSPFGPRPGQFGAWHAQATQHTSPLSWSTKFIRPPAVTIRLPDFSEM
jgi:hypothetical protein